QLVAQGQELYGALKAPTTLRHLESRPPRRVHVGAARRRNREDSPRPDHQVVHRGTNSFGGDLPSSVRAPGTEDRTRVAQVRWGAEASIQVLQLEVHVDVHRTS